MSQFSKAGHIYSSDFNTTSFNWWMKTAAKGGQAKPEQGNATSFTGG